MPLTPSMYYVYILECEDGSLYTGCTNDVERRFAQHQAGKGGHYTRAKKPLRILYTEEQVDRGSALRREAEIKKLPREKKLAMIHTAKHVEIVPMCTDDVEAVTRVYYKTWLSTYPNEAAGISRDDVEALYANAFSEESLQKRREQIAQQHDNELSLVARCDGTVVGVCRVAREDAVNRLSSIYVLSDYQGMGIGSRLWEKALNFLERSKDTVVEVVDYNTPAIRFYENRGFVDTGVKKKNKKFQLNSGASFTERVMLRPAEHTE